MTLIVAIKSPYGLVLAADGMAYCSYGSSDLPHPASKIRTVSATNWVFAFAGQGSAESAYHAVEARLESGRLSLDKDIRSGAPAYLRAVAMEHGADDSNTFVLAGYEPHGTARVYVQAGNGLADLAPPVLCIGAQHEAATWIINTLLHGAAAITDVQFLAWFAIAQIAQQELKVGHPEHYAIEVCTIKASAPPQHLDARVLADFSARSSRLNKYLRKSLAASALVSRSRSS